MRLGVQPQQHAVEAHGEAPRTLRQEDEDDKVARLNAAPSESLDGGPIPRLG